MGDVMRNVFLLAIAALLVLPTFARAEDAAQILAKTDANLNNFNNLHMTSTMTVKASDGTAKVREIKVWLQGDSRMVKFAKPASDVGIALLSTDSKTNFVYLPEYKKVRRVASHVRNQTFMGTDFSQEDMAILRYADEFTPKIESETATHWILELTRKPGADISYAKLQLTVKKDNYTIDKIVYHDNSGAPQKTEERANYSKHQSKKGEYWTMSKITMTDIKTGHQTVLENSGLQIDLTLEPDFFSERNLKRPVQ